MVKVSPSLLAADFADLKTELTRISTADMLHLDVMDGHFVPNITIGVPVVSSLRRATDLMLDVHLMISQPERYLESFAQAGADLLCVHYEATRDIPKVLETIRRLGKRAALAIKPATPADAVLPYLQHLDMVLVMTVEPGFGGQAFIQQMLPKIHQIRMHAGRVKPGLDIQVDGGINRRTAPLAVQAGANVLVAGNALFHVDSTTEEIAFFHALRELH